MAGMTNATEIVRSLNSAEIRQRIDEIDRERKALLTLLRAAVRAEPQRMSLRPTDPSQQTGRATR
jgi:hypothetical protein